MSEHAFEREAHNGSQQSSRGPAAIRRLTPEVLTREYRLFLTDEASDSSQRAEVRIAYLILVGMNTKLIFDERNHLHDGHRIDNSLFEQTIVVMQIEVRVHVEKVFLDVVANSGDDL